MISYANHNKNEKNFVYHDHWTEEGVFIYSGEGKNGDQELKARNKTLADAKNNGKIIELIITLSPNEYYYQGKFLLIEYFKEYEKGSDGVLRQKLKFKLKKYNSQEQNQ